MLTALGGKRPMTRRRHPQLCPDWRDCRAQRP